MFILPYSKRLMAKPAADRDNVNSSTACSRDSASKRALVTPLIGVPPKSRAFGNSELQVNANPRVENPKAPPLNCPAKTRRGKKMFKKRENERQKQTNKQLQQDLKKKKRKRKEKVRKREGEKERRTERERETWWQ